MTNKLARETRGYLSIFLVAMTIAFLQGCNSDKYSTDSSQISKSIVDILVNETDEYWNCIIKGNHPLTFSAINNPSPKGVMLYFPDTTLSISNLDVIQPNNEIIETIRADEYKEGDLTNTRIIISLNLDRPYSISTDENELYIGFPKSLNRPVSFELMPGENQANQVDSEKPAFPPARELQKITATLLENHIVVNVDADGTISNYKSFVIDNPARIVFDIFGLGSSHSEGQTITVESKWVKQIRHHPYPEKIRLVLDTESQFLTDFFSFPTGSGLLIYVGQLPEPLGKTGRMISPVK